MGETRSDLLLRMITVYRDALRQGVDAEMAVEYLTLISDYEAELKTLRSHKTRCGCLVSPAD